MSESFNWHCVKCPSNSIKAGMNTRHCQKCNGEMISNLNRTVCYDPYVLVYLDADDNVVIFVLFIVSVGSLFNVMTIGIFTKLRKTPVIRASGLHPSLLQLSMHLLVFILLPACFLNKLTQTKCFVQPVVFGSLFTIISTVTMTKTLKALHAFKSSLVLSKRSVMVTKVTEWFLLLLLLIIRISICAVSFFNQLPTIESTRNRKQLTRHIYCTNNVHLQLQIGYLFLLSFFCLIQAFRGRKLPGRFNESIKTTYSMLLTAVTFSILIVISQSQANSKSSGLIFLVSLIIININQLVMMYSHKVYLVLYHPETNTKTAFQSSMMRNAEKMAAHRIKHGKQESAL